MEINISFGAKSSYPLGPYLSFPPERICQVSTINVFFHFNNMEIAFVLYWRLWEVVSLCKIFLSLKLSANKGTMRSHRSYFGAMSVARAKPPVACRERWKRLPQNHSKVGQLLEFKNHIKESHIFLIRQGMRTWITFPYQPCQNFLPQETKIHCRQKRNPILLK